MNETQIKELVEKTVRDAIRKELGDTRERTEVMVWVKLQMQQAEERREMIAKVKTSLLGQIVIWITVGVGFAVWTAIQKQILKQ